MYRGNELQRCVHQRPHCRCALLQGGHVVAECYTEKGPNASHRQGTQKTGNTYNQANRRSTDTQHRPSTKLYRKGNPGDAAAVHASAQQQPATTTVSQQGYYQILSINAARCEV